MTIDPAVFPLTIYYESACPLCNAEMSNLMLRNGQGLMRFVDISEPGFQDAPEGTRLEDLMALIHARRADGQVIRGVEVFRLAYGAAGLGGIQRLLSTPLIAPLAERAYPWVARHRHQFPRWLVRLAFETGIRRAALRAARARCAPEGRCRIR